MIDRFLGDDFEVLFCPFWRSVLQCGARLLLHTLQLLDRAVSGARFLTGGVFECDIAHRRSVAILYMLYQIRCNPVHPLNGALPGPYVQCGLHAVLWSHIGSLMLLLAAEPQDLYSLLRVPLDTIRLCATGGFQERGQCFFIGLSRSIPTIVFDYFSLSLLSVYRLVFWGWGLRTDRVYITLSRPWSAELF